LIAGFSPVTLALYPVEGTAMKNVSSVRAYCILAALLVAVSIAAVAPAGAGGAVDEVERLEAARRSAMIDGDRAALEGLLAPECTYTHSTGLVQTRAEVIEMLESKKVRYVSFTTPSETAHAFGSGTVVVTGTQTIGLEVEGKPLSTTNRFTVVWVDLDGAWKCVAYQSTAVPESKE